MDDQYPSLAEYLRESWPLVKLSIFADVQSGEIIADLWSIESGETKRGYLIDKVIGPSIDQALHELNNRIRP